MFGRRCLSSLGSFGAGALLWGASLSGMFAARPVQAAVPRILERDVLNYLVDQAELRYQVSAKDITARWVGPPLDMLLGDWMPEDAWELRVDPQQRILGDTVVPVQVWVHDHPVRTLFPHLDITAYQRVLVASREIQAGEPIDATDSRPERRALDMIWGVPLLPGKDVREARAVREIPSGTVLTDSILALPLAVKSGSMVDVRLDEGGLMILTSGQALIGGQVGQRIMVSNPSSGRQYAARVSGPDQVIVHVEDDQ